MSSLTYERLCAGRALQADQHRRELAERDALLLALQTDLLRALGDPPDVDVRAAIGDRRSIDGTLPLAIAVPTPSGPVVVHGSVLDRREADGQLRAWDVELRGARAVSVHPDSAEERRRFAEEAVSAFARAAGLSSYPASRRSSRRSQFFRRPESDPELRPWRRETPGWARARLRQAQRSARLHGLRAGMGVIWTARVGLWRELAWALHRVLRAWNALLLPPLAVLIVLELTLGGLPELLNRELDHATVLFCSCFGLEFALAWGLARNRWRFVGNLWNLADLVSTIPLATLFQVARLGRASRVVRLLRLVKLVRGRRMAMPIRRTFWALGVATSATLSGAIALESVEPGTVPSLGDAVWWSLVTVSTVGYGDISPETAVGRAVAGVLIVVGLGVFSYTTGQFTAAVEDPEEARILQTVEEARRHILRMEARVLALCSAEGIEAGQRAHDIDWDQAPPEVHGEDPTDSA